MPPLLKGYERQLFLAAHRGDVDALRRLCKENAPEANVNITDEGNYTPLTIAILQGNVQAVLALVELGADVKKGPDNVNALKKGLSPVQVAVDEGHLDILTILVEHGADPSIQRGKSGNLLHVAAMYGYLGIVQWLVQACGIPVNTRIAENGRTALHVASSTHRNSTIRWLLANGANPLAYDDEQKTPLHLAISVDCAPNSSTLRQLIRAAGAEGLAKQDRFGRTPLHEACYRRKTVAVKMLIERDANLFAIDHLGHTPLFEAGYSDAELVELMVQQLESRGTPPHQIREELNRKDLSGWSSLHHAIFCGEIQAVQSLLTLGARPDMLEQSHGESVLHLVGHGFSIDWDQRAKKAPQPWHQQYQQATKWLLAYGKWFLRYPVVIAGWPTARIPSMPDVEGLEDCYHVKPFRNDGGTDMSKLLLAKGASVMVKDDDGNLPFFIPASIGNTSEVFLMLRAAAHEGLFRNVRQQEQPQQQEQPVMDAVILQTPVKTRKDDTTASIVAAAATDNAVMRSCKRRLSNPVTPSPMKRPAQLRCCGDV